MPEKPKRKNKNKNKRKNKNNRADNNKNNCDVTEKESEGSCSAQIALKEAIPISEKDFNGLVPENTLAENGISENDIDSEIQRCDTSTNAVCVSEDVNNNSSAIAANTLHVPIEHLNDVDDNKNIEEHETDAYLVESPEQSLKSKPKLNNTNKSKSLDNDDAPKIVDITEDNVLQSEEESSTAFVDTSNILVSDAESDIEWEKTEDVEIRRIDDMAAESMSISTAPLNVALCQQVNISLSPDIEASLRSYLHTLDLSTHPENSIEIKAEIEQIINREIRHRLRKKGFADDLGLQRLAPPRKLDVINEEGSSESSQSSRRQSYLSDKKSDNEDLEDDVFEDKNKFQQKNAKWAETTSHKRAYGRLVPQQCMLVGAKIKEPEVTEARGDWSMQTVEKMTGAEIVYLTDSSSSTSSLHDYGDETDDGMETDVSVRMITPTIEVTDTENLLKNSFIASSPDKLRDKKVNPTKEHIIHNKDYNQDNIEIAKKDKIRDNSTQNSNEILVLSTDNIVTNLYVKDVEPTLPNIDVNEKLSSKITNLSNDENVVNIGDKYDLEIKVLKCELNDAINNLIKEVSDSEQHETSKDTFARQDSSSSVSSSQCTAKYNPTSSSLNDISNILHDETEEDKNLNAKNNESKTTSSHVKDVFEHVAGATNVDMTQLDVTAVAPSHLRDLCVRRIASFPYGDKILEELASVSKRIQKITGAFITENTDSNITNFSKIDFSKKNKIRFYDAPPIENIVLNSSKSLNQESVPPPTQPRHSSLKKKSRDEEVRFGVPAKTEPVYVCLSPSQKMLMEKTQTIIAKEDVNELPNMNQKFVDQRNYNENYSREQHTDQKADDISPIVSFKSQTGSRLLALIRDPTVTKSVNIPNERLDQLEQKSTVPQTNSKKHENIFDVPHTFNTFRPIPPPRPKKLASSFYESDESSDFTDSSMRSMKSERKVFHFSTGNLNKEIEDDISSIQNMHRYYMNTRETINESPRRPSLPKDLCDQQMEYIRQKEKEVEAEIQRLESLKNNTPSAPPKLGPRAPLLSETEENDRVFKDSNNYFISKRRDFFASLSAPEKQEKPFPNSDYKKEKGNLSKVFSSSQEELLREKMYSEYVTQMAQREERKQHKVIKITNTPVATSSKTSKSMPTINRLDSKVNNRIEKEFISKARERWDKLGIVDPETEDETDTSNNVYKEPKVIEHKIKVIEGGQEKDVTNLPSHLQEFVRFTSKEKEQRNDSSETVMITPTFKARSTSPAVWRPGGPPPPGAPAAPASSPGAPPLPPPPPVWTPGSSPLAGRKTYRPVHFEDTPPTRRKFGNPDQNGCASGSESEGRGLTTSRSAPVTGFNTLSSNTTSRLPRAQNPTVTLLQKAREGQIPRGSSYIQEEARLPRDRPSPPRGDPVYALRREYASETEGERSEHERGSRKMADAQKKIDGIGPITREGMPVSLRSEVKDPSKWYKKMYDTIHKNKYDDDYVTIRYKSRRGQPPERVTSNKSQYAYFDPRSGYLSEPEGGLSRLAGSTWSDAYDSDVTSGPRRRTASVQEDRRMNETITYHMPNNKYSTLASGRASQEVYKGQPGRIENYMPGRSSVVDKEAKQWWDEVMDIFDGQNISSTTSLPQASPKEKKDITSAILSKSNMARALKESGYESDSTLVFRRREETDGPLSPAERRAAYRDLQAGGEPPLRGFRSPAPHRQESDSAPEPPRRTSHGSYSDTESPRRYVESDVNIHYRCPVRHDPLPLVPEKELARQQAEHMKRLYREQRRNKYLQELQDMQNRRHQDNFTPSQKNILPLNRYDEAERVIAKALYTFNGQTPRELSFRKGDVIHVRRQIDSNWYEGEIHGRIGLFPYNYVEIQKGDTIQAPKKAAIVEGRARAKFDFNAQTNLELPLKKGEVVVLTRRIDQNWWEGRNGTKTGIFPDSYVSILQEPSQNKPEPQPMSRSDKPVASPAAHGLMNGSAKRSMGAHSYLPQQNSQALSNAPPATQPLPGYTTRQAQSNQTPSERGYGPPTGAGVDLNNSEPLYVDTNAEAIPYRAMYKYRPQNPDELELSEGDTVYVLEKCDDGWYVGSSQRTGRFGTFPGNYVERI